MNPCFAAGFIRIDINFVAMVDESGNLIQDERLGQAREIGDEEGYFHLFHYGVDNSTVSVDYQQSFPSFSEIINSADNEL